MLKRSWNVITLLVILSSVAAAQTDPSRNSPPGKPDGAARARLREQQQQLNQAVQDYQQQVQALNDEQEDWTARYRIFQNVTSLRSKDALMNYLDDRRKSLGLSEKDGYRRIGITDAYNDRSYLRFYDDTTGELKIGEVRGSYDELERARKDFETRRYRLEEQRSGIESQYQDLFKQTKAVKQEKAIPKVQRLENTYWKSKNELSLRIGRRVQFDEKPYQWTYYEQGIALKMDYTNTSNISRLFIVYDDGRLGIPVQSNSRRPLWVNNNEPPKAAEYIWCEKVE